MTASLPMQSPRLPFLDALRGLAIVGMVVYHFAWDLGFLGFIGLDVTIDPAWVVFARVLLSAFLLLAGFSLYLSHGRGIRWRAFGRRFAMVAGAALAITAATWWMFPTSFVFFGVLHAIALSSLFGLAFVRLPAFVVLGAALVIIGLPLFLHAEAFSAPTLAWIGFWIVPPPANDLVPMFPWFGVFLLGIAAAKFLRGTALETRLAGWAFDDVFGRALQLLGRWSLIIYVLHQPLMLAVLFPIASFTGAGEAQRHVDFVGSCQSQCVDNANGEAFCVLYCQCALGTVIADDLWDAIESPVPTQEQADAVTLIRRQCQAPGG